MIRLLELEEIGHRKTRLLVECDGVVHEYLHEQIEPAPGFPLTKLPDRIYLDLERYALPPVPGRPNEVPVIPAVTRLRRIVLAFWAGEEPALPLVVASSPPVAGSKTSDA